MNHLSITQSYMLCALNEKGKLPAMSMEIPTCIVAGSILDLILEKYITIENKKLSAVARPGENHQYLITIYDYIEKKGTIKLDKLASEYCFTATNKKMNILIHNVGESLAAQNCVISQQGGVFGNKDIFIPNREMVDRVIQHIRAELLEDGDLSDEMIALVSLMNKSGMIKRYFSTYEKDLLKLRLKEIKKSASHKVVSELVDYVTTMFVVIITASS